MINNIKYDRWKELYENHMSEDFPSNELYTLNQFLKNKELKKVYSYEENGIEKAYMVVAQMNEVILIQYFAVYKKYRGQGIGTKFLKEYLEQISSDKTILLEIENPEEVKNKNKYEYEKRVKRQKFYEKLGFIVDNRIKKYDFFQDYLLLTTSKQLPISYIKQEVFNIYNSITTKDVMNRFYMEIEENY